MKQTKLSATPLHGRPAGNKFRVDSYDPVAGEIVSRKNTQLAGVKLKTAIGYMNEELRKYPAGSTITESDFDPAILRGGRLEVVSRQVVELGGGVQLPDRDLGLAHCSQ